MKLDDVLALRLAEFAHAPRSFTAGRIGTVNGYVVRHPDGVVLYDTGLCIGHPDVDRALRPRVRDLVAELSRAGIRRQDVVAITNSHLHFDHCGGNRLFPGVPIYAQEREYVATLRPFYTVTACVEFSGAAYRLLRGDVEILPGIRILATPGHTPGHQSLLVDTADGPIILAGHAFYTLDEYEGRAAAQESSPEGRASGERLRALRPRRLHFAHDPRVWDAEGHGARTVTYQKTP